MQRGMGFRIIAMLTQITASERAVRDNNLSTTGYHTISRIWFSILYWVWILGLYLLISLINGKKNVQVHISMFSFFFLSFFFLCVTAHSRTNMDYNHSSILFFKYLWDFLMQINRNLPIPMPSGLVGIAAHRDLSKNVKFYPELASCQNREGQSNEQ